MSEWDFAFGLTGQALEDAHSTGATREEWGLIEQKLEREDVIGKHWRHVFVFVDAENVPSKFWGKIERSISYLVDRWRAKAYALQKDRATQGWHEIAMTNDWLKEIRLMGPPAKNKVDEKIIGDIRRLIGDCVPAKTSVFIVSSDSDYWDVVAELKGAGVRVIGIGEAKANEMYKNSFDHFIELDAEDIDESDDIHVCSNEPPPPWYVGGSGAYRYGEQPPPLAQQQ